MTGRQEWFLVATVVVLTTAELTPPPYVPRGLEPPKDKENCRLHVHSPFAFVVGIRDGDRYVGMGSMITPIALVTTCRQFPVSSNSRTYVAIGVFIWNTSHPDDTCAQEKPVEHIERHHHCSTNHITFFDFAVFVLKAPFEITGMTYPLAPMPQTPLELLWRIIVYDETPVTEMCFLPLFKDQNERIPHFNWKASAVQAIPYHPKCVELLCQEEEDKGTSSAQCKNSLGDRANGTLLCMKVKNEDEIKFGPDHEYWYAGTPLVCNGYALAMITQPKERMHWSESQYDFHFGVTFLRAWVWLEEMKATHQPPWIRKERIYVGNITEKGFRIPNPFIQLPPLYRRKGRGVANVPASILQNWICSVLIYSLVILP